MFKFNNRNTIKRLKLCEKSAIKTPEQRQWCCSGAFIIDFEQMSYLFVVSL